jgi:DNA-binding MarR family transcriptional regulator
MEGPYKIGWQIKVLSNLIKREAVNYGCEKDFDELTGNNMFIIRHLAKYGENDVFQKDLEEIFSVRRSTMSAIILRMEKKGFLIRESVPYDARLKKIVLTEKGKHIHEMIESRITDTEEKLAFGLSEEEKRTLCFLLEKLRRNLEPEN